MATTIRTCTIVLPRNDRDRIRRLQDHLGLASDAEVVRKALDILEETTDRRALQAAFRRASLATRRVGRDDIADLDHLSDEGSE